MALKRSLTLTATSAQKYIWRKAPALSCDAWAWEIWC